MKKISFVIPCYRSEKTIEKVVDEVRETMVAGQETDYEIVLINDGSPDNVWSVISDLAKKDDRIIAVNLAKNFGQHCALMAGFHYTSGDIVVTLDDDGQTPASDSFKLIDKINEGYDVAYATYMDYRQSWFRKMGSILTNKMMYYLLDVKENWPDGTSFRAMKRFIVDEIMRYNHPYPYIFGLVLRTTRNITMVPVEHRDRIQGSSGYTLISLIKLWTNSLTAFSVKPLEIGVYLGLFFACCGFLTALGIIIGRIVSPDIQLGWSSTIALMLIIGGIIMMMLGLIGEYIGRIYICLNNAPQFVIKDVVDKVEIQE